MVGLAIESGAVTTDCLATGLNRACVGSSGVSVHAAMAETAARAMRERVRMKNLRSKTSGTVWGLVTLRLGFGDVKRFCVTLSLRGRRGFYRRDRSCPTVLIPPLTRLRLAPLVRRHPAKRLRELTG